MKLKKIISLNLIFLVFNIFFITNIYAGPNSTNYELKNYTFGGGSTDGSSSTNFKVNGIIGELETGATTKTFASDKYSRTVSGGWGTADTGGSYTVLNGQAVDHNVNGSQGTILVNAANTQRAIGLNSVSAQDINMSAKVAVDKIATGSGENAILSGRIISTNNEYRTTVKLLSDNTMRIYVSKIIAGTETVLSSVINPGLNYSVNSYFWIKQEVYGSSPTTINAKVWLEGSTEPAVWNISGLSDSSSPLQAAGSVALKLFLYSDVTNAPVTFAFDDLLVVSHYALNGGFNSTLVNTPLSPIFTNPSNWTNKLSLTLNPGSDASDTKYAIAISSDNFTNNVQFVKNTNNIGSTLALTDWQTYTSWGGSSGISVLGLTPGTIYTVKVASKKGNYTQSGYGLIAQAATLEPSLTFDIDVGTTSSVNNAAPYAIDLGQMNAGTVTTSTNKVWLDLDTNASSGLSVYILGTNNGLFSTYANTTITSATADLSSALTGYGARNTSVAQTSGGPMTSLTPYNGASNNVGIVDSSRRLIFDSSSQSVTVGRVGFEIKAKVKADTRAANDYGDILKMLVTATF